MFISGYNVSAFPPPAGGLRQVYTECETVCVSTCSCSYVERVEAPADRRHHIELPVLQVVPERVRHVVGIKSQDPETGEQRAAAGRHVRSQENSTPERAPNRQGDAGKQQAPRGAAEKTHTKEPRGIKSGRKHIPPARQGSASAQCRHLLDRNRTEP